MDDMDVCEKSEIVVNTPSVVPSVPLQADSEEIATVDVGVRGESDIVVDIPAVVPSVVPVDISDETRRIWMHVRSPRVTRI